MDKVKLGRLIGFLSLVVLSAYICMFHLNPLNVFVNVYLKVVSVGVIPGVVCFSWIYFWRDGGDPFNFLSLWNCGTQVLFLAVNLLRLPVGSWGVFGWLYALLSVAIIGVYVTKYAFTKWGFWIIGVMILLNVVLAFGVVLTTYQSIHPFFAASESVGIQALGVFVSELGVMGAMFTSSSQLYWHDILKRIREEAYIEQIFDSLDATEPLE
ncbi:hypothetical protein JXL21_14715 [Candidatus Bathyarchaeota archaeon]|nr:hypothetical protein [Candidatus Bathyarchaeota archaeon]